MATHKVNQLDINIGRIPDPATRDALQSIVTFVNEMTQKIRTSQEVKAGRLVNADESCGLEKDGGLFGKSLELEGGGSFKVMVISDQLASLASRTIQFSSGSRILGAFGWSQNNTTSDWWPILDVDTSTAAGRTNDIYIGLAEIDSITLTSGDGNSTNKFHLVIFYADR